jgi:hypothetical protein
MTTTDTRQKIHQRIEQLRPEQLNLLTDFLDFLQFKASSLAPSTQPKTKRKAGLHPDNFVMRNDFDAPLPDSFWLGEN